MRPPNPDITVTDRLVHPSASPPSGPAADLAAVKQAARPACGKAGAR